MDKQSGSCRVLGKEGSGVVRLGAYRFRISCADELEVQTVGA